MKSSQSVLGMPGHIRRAISATWATLIIGVMIITSSVTGIAAVNLQHLPLFGGEYFADPYTPTQAQALAQANAFDFILAPRTSMYASYAASMHAANPRLKLLVYLEGMFSYPSTASSYPESWFAHDASGKRIGSVMFPGNLLMNPTSSGWISNRSSACASMLKASPGFDGCIVDDMGRGVFYKNYVTGPPFNSATGANWTLSDWLKATTSMTAAMKSAVTPKLMFVNSLSSGHSYFDPTGPTSQLLSAADGAMAETFVRAAYTGTTSYPSVNQWLEDVRMVADAAAKGKYIIAAVKIWVSGTQAQYAAWDMYGMATFLMGYNGFAYFHFRSDRLPSSTATLATAIGTPNGAFYQTAKGYYERDFSTGLVLFNPATSTYSITLPKAYRTLSGTLVTSLTLGPTSGVILLG
jgi:hypothetical protein